jgi:hypothetical protein
MIVVGGCLASGRLTLPDSGQNVRLQVLVNGKVKGTAAMKSSGVLTVILDWAQRDPSKVPPEVRQHPDFNKEWQSNEVHLRLAGLDSVADQHVEWLTDTLQVGDEVTVRVLSPGKYDPPRKKRPRSEAT